MAIVAGLDEVGRGAFAGPLMAGCVVMPSVTPPKGIQIDDSKRLTKKQRESAAIWIKENSIAWGIGKASSKYIDRFGLTMAENLAFRQAVVQAQKKFKVKIELLVVDAFFVPFLKGLPKTKQFVFKKGDSKAISIACASIIAKVERDALMIRLSSNKRYVQYGWDKNKGYGTKIHRDAISQYGITTHHRRLFLDV